LKRPEESLLSIEGAAGLSPGYIEAINHRYPVYIEDLRFNEGPSSQAFLTGRPVIVEDIEVSPGFQRWRALARQQGVHSLISLPIPAQNGCIGTLVCYQCHLHHYHDDEMLLLTGIAAHIGTVIEIAYMIEAQQKIVHQLEEATKELSERHHSLEHSITIHNTLTQLVLTNQGLLTIASTLALAAGCPVLVQDQFYQVIVAVDEHGQPSTRYSPLTQDMLTLCTLQPESQSSSSLFVLPTLPKRGLDQARAVASIVAGQKILGYISIVLPISPASPLTLLVLEQGSYAIAMEMIKGHLVHEVEQRVRHGFADDLITGRYDDAKQMQDRSRYLGYDLRGPFQVLVFDFDRIDHSDSNGSPFRAELDVEALHQRLFNDVQHMIRTCGLCALVANHQSQLVMILLAIDEPNEKVRERAVTAIRHTVCQLSPDLSVSAGIGQVYPHLDRIRTSYREATHALQVLRRLGGRAKVLTYSDLGVTRLLFQVENAAELIDYARTRLRAVLAYDQQHNGVLIQTLEAYLAANQSVPLASQQLDLHPNTFRYRLRKVEVLLGASLNSTALLLDLQLACLILHIIDTEALFPLAV
jgi:sugar diacid utilization regulator